MSPLLSTTTSVSFDDSVPLPSHAGDLIDGSKRRPLVPAEEATSVSSWTDTGSIVSPSLSIDSAYTLGEHHAFPPQSHGGYHQYKYPHSPSAARQLQQRQQQTRRRERSSSRQRRQRKRTSTFVPTLCREAGQHIESRRRQRYRGDDDERETLPLL
jgi:hypothetical protein